MVSLGDNSKMRADIPLYIIAIICFALAVSLHLYSTMVGEVASTYTVILAILGAIFAGAGYSMRPKSTIETETIEKAEARKEVTAETEAKPSLELIDVKGIGPKRAEQLKKIGIQSVEDLAKESSEELSKKAKVSTKIADKWIKAAKEALKEEE